MEHGQLAIVIPVWNLPQDLADLLVQIEAMGIFSQVIIADDASEPACDPKALGFPNGLASAELIYLRSPVQKGAGHARNMGLKAVTTDNVLFFDADDRLCDELSRIWQQHLQAEMPDFTIFRHSDTRVEDNDGRQGTFANEEAKWKKVLHNKATNMLTPEERADLVLISAYPWNKIYRTDFLRENNITCSETPVHNDIRLHWLSFLRAQSVQASNLIGAQHVIADRKHHLTARKGEERLCLGDILEDVTHQIRQGHSHRLLMRRFIQFVDTVCRWNLDLVDLDLRPAFRDLAAEAYLRFTSEEFRLFSVQQPERAARIVQFLLSEKA